MNRDKIRRQKATTARNKGKYGLARVVDEDVDGARTLLGLEGSHDLDVSQGLRHHRTEPVGDLVVVGGGAEVGDGVGVPAKDGDLQLRRCQQGNHMESGENMKDNEID